MPKASIDLRIEFLCPYTQMTVVEGVAYDGVGGVVCIHSKTSFLTMKRGSLSYFRQSPHMSLNHSSEK